MVRSAYQPKDDPGVFSRLAWILVSLLFFAAAFCIIWATLGEPFLEEKTFESTRGQILSITTESTHRVGSNTMARFGIKSCEYRYEVNGVEYTNNRTYPGLPSASEEPPKDFVVSPLLAPEALDSYRPEGRVTVFYQKENPKISGLFAGFYHFDTPTSTSGFGWILLCGFLLILAYLLLGIGSIMLFYGSIRGQHNVYLIRRIAKFCGSKKKYPLDANAK